MIKVAIADDHPMVITGLRNMLANYDHIVISGAYTNGSLLLEGLQDQAPDVLLLDIQMPGQTGDELAPRLIKRFPQMAILTLTNFDNVLYINSMLRHGVSGYLLKTTDPRTLIKAIETVADGGQFVDQSIEEKVRQLRIMEKETNFHPLTLREKEILQNLVSGATTKEIAEKLFLSFYTVENYRARILQKLQVRNTAELIRKALVLGLA